MKTAKNEGCICRSWCRSDLYSVVIAGKLYPGPDHADGCPSQKRERFVRVEYEGRSCVIEAHEVEAMRKDLVSDQYTFTDVMLTRDQFDRMDEFQGF